ncbi:hypothetical protein KUV47_14180 [Vannielia litorea]|uniref:hypothetical protein n=1 Tax=Vannielia litorea TaxID=1217970 RepID=UPI001C95DA62|nr:hypothetical protein [Vannielia litorea]MBY6154366.1 hypothetical protein [Vannielia litorea]
MSYRKRRAAKARPASPVVDAPAPAPVAAPRKPRVIIAGEFSAGKTRLITGLLGADVLPSNVTATALPPVWLVSGHNRIAAVDLEGNVRDLDTLKDISVEDTHYCVVSHPAEILKTFEIIDTPGSSDPGIAAESWERMMEFADMAVWCTNATQAWRQSEKSVWDELPEHLVGPALMLVTHADRMPDERTAERVMRRVRREAKKYFSHFEMASLIRPDQVERVSGTLGGIVSELSDLAGSKNPVLEELTRRWESEPAPAAPQLPEAPKVMPKRFERSETAIDLAAPAFEMGGEILRLNVDTPTTRTATEVSAFRAAWNEMIEVEDASDPAAILFCVERYISMLEENGSTFSGDDPSSHSTAFERETKSRMNGR